MAPEVTNTDVRPWLPSPLTPTQRFHSALKTPNKCTFSLDAEEPVRYGKHTDLREEGGEAACRGEVTSAQFPRMSRVGTHTHVGVKAHIL